MTDPKTNDGLIGHATVLHPRFVVRASTIKDAEGVRAVADEAARVPDLEAKIGRLQREVRALRCLRSAVLDKDLHDRGLIPIQLVLLASRAEDEAHE